MKPMVISIIVAADQGGVIGRKGDLPWKIRSDLSRFAKLTRGHTVIAGRKTHESIVRRLGHPLKGRLTIVLTRKPRYRAKGCRVVHSLEEALKLAEESGEDEVFVIGGEEVYREALEVADRIYLTLVHVFVEGDAHFPSFETNGWRQVESELPPKGEDDDYSHTFFIYERKEKSPEAA